MTSEPYANAPAALVACEIRYPAAEADIHQVQGFRASLHDTLPIAKTEEVQQIEAVVGSQPFLKKMNVTRLLTRDRTSSASIWPDRVVIETTEYPGYTEFRGLVEKVVSAVATSIAPSGIERVGFRFVDEVRPPQQPIGLEWGEWVATELIGPASLGPDRGTPVDWQGLARFHVQDEIEFVLRYGPREAPAVNPDGPLRRVRTILYPACFVFDSDSFWTATEEIPEFDSVHILRLCDELHRPLADVFEQLTTDRLKNYMQGED